MNGHFRADAGQAASRLCSEPRRPVAVPTPRLRGPDSPGAFHIPPARTRARGRATPQGRPGGRGALRPRLSSTSQGHCHRGGLGSVE